MSAFYTPILVIQALAALGVIILVLLQHGKGADMGAAFGSGASGTLFGASGSANVLSRLTAGLAATFFICTLGLAAISNSRAPGNSKSVVDEFSKPPATAPAVPKAGAVPPATNTAVPPATSVPAASNAVPAANPAPAATAPAATSPVPAATTPAPATGAPAVNSTTTAPTTTAPASTAPAAPAK
jgi:preprotein translocase subunit SecG